MRFCFLVAIISIIFSQNAYSLFTKDEDKLSKPFFKNDRTSSIYFIGGVSFLPYSQMSDLQSLGAESNDFTFVDGNSTDFLTSKYKGATSAYSTGVFLGMGYKAIDSSIRHEVVVEYLSLISEIKKDALVKISDNEMFSEYGIYQRQYRGLYKLIYNFDNVFSIGSMPVDLFIGAGVGPSFITGGLFKNTLITTSDDIKNISDMDTELKDNAKIEYLDVKQVNDASDEKVYKSPVGVGLTFEVFAGASFNITQNIALETKVKYAGTTNPFFTFGDGEKSAEGGLILSWIGLDGSVLFKAW